VWYSYDSYKLTKKEIEDQRLALKKYEVHLKDVSLKKEKLARSHQQNLKELARAQKTNEAAQEKITVLQQQIKKLQTELQNARQKAKRLANKVKPVE
jgi:chromosome segregation ATPase